MWSDTPASGFVLREDSQTILRCWEPCEMEFFWEAEVGRAGAGKKKHRREWSIWLETESESKVCDAIELITQPSSEHPTRADVI